MKNSTSTVVDRGLAAARHRATATEGERDDARESRLSPRRAIATATATATASRRRALRERTRPHARVRDARARRRESSRDDDETRRRGNPSRASRHRTTTTTIARARRTRGIHFISFTGWRLAAARKRRRVARPVRERRGSNEKKKGTSLRRARHVRARPVDAPKRV